MQKLLLLLPAVAASLFLTSCADDEYYSDYDRRPVYHDGYVADADYYDDGYDDSDFVYVERRPYSRIYGPLVLRGDRYYYSRGGRLMIYNRGRVGRPRATLRVDDRHRTIRHRAYDDGPRPRRRVDWDE